TGCSRRPPRKRWPPRPGNGRCRTVRPNGCAAGPRPMPSAATRQSAARRNWAKTGCANRWLSAARRPDTVKAARGGLCRASGSEGRPMAEYETILVERRGAVTLVTLNRPEALNALSSAVLEDLIAAFAAFEADDGQRC